jgi:hypothetical protein
METKEIQQKIISILKERGPSLPIQIAKETEMSSLFISAFLSELTNEKRIKVSNLKVGGSPLYYLEGQEEKLEQFYKYLHPKEAEAFLLLKEKKVLKDSDQEPAIRVALRSIRDFAVGFRKDEEIYWRFHSMSEEEIKEQEQPKKIKRIEPKIKQIKEPKPDVKFQNPLIREERPAQKKEKPKSDFVLRTIEFLNKEEFKIIEEKDYKTKEYNCIIEVNSNLGPIKFITQAKDKKTITDLDLKKILSESQRIPLPALMIYTQDLSKKAKEYAENYSSVLKTIKIE